ncbi:MAG TPA: GNAT family N-acetyltransferase [Glaciihabitans sp.]|nr:GNAT family N-acetyltransferase [Glaciihabitans sp.]
MLDVRRAMPADTGGCAAIVLGLPEYFTDDVGEKIATSMRTHPAWVVTNSGGLAGFVIVDRRSVRAAEILWVAVAAELRGSGVGTLLLDHVLGDLVKDGLQLVEVKTLRSSRQTDGCGV